MSTVFRVVKNSNYTTLSNYHFKDKRLSWKAKGLLSTMLSLPDDWNYTIEGLATLSDDGIKSTNSGLAELEKCGYLVRTQLRGENGRFGMTEYVIYEQPMDHEKVEDLIEEEEDITIVDCDSQPLCRNGQTDENTAFSPLCQKRQTEKRFAEKGVQLNTNILNTKESNTYNSSSSGKVKHDPLPEDEEEDVRKRLKVGLIEQKYPKELVKMVFKQVCKRNDEFIRLMDARSLEQICFAITARQRGEPIMMLPNLINTYLDNIMIGIKAIGSGSSNAMRALYQNDFNDFQQHDYDFQALEKALLSN